MASKGAETRERILDHAVRIASRDGLEGLSIGSLASELGLSKSGLFAHFGSKEQLQVQTLERSVAQFRERVLKPGFAARRGEPRIRAVFARWLDWSDDPDRLGGCLIVAASIELDDKPGPARDYLVAVLKELFSTLERSARLGVEAGHFRADTDVAQFAFELYGILLGYQNTNRMLRDPAARTRAATALDRLIASVRSEPVRT